MLFSSSRFVLCDKDVNPVTLDYTTISGKVVSGSWSPCDILVIGVGIKTANLSNDTTSYALHNSWLFCKALWNRDALYLDQSYQSWALLVQNVGSSLPDLDSHLHSINGHRSHVIDVPYFPTSGLAHINVLFTSA